MNYQPLFNSSTSLQNAILEILSENSGDNITNKPSIKNSENPDSVFEQIL